MDASRSGNRDAVSFSSKRQPVALDSVATYELSGMLLFDQDRRELMPIHSPNSVLRCSQGYRSPSTISRQSIPWGRQICILSTGERVCGARKQDSADDLTFDMTDMCRECPEDPNLVYQLYI